MIKEKNINISENLVATKIFHTVDPLAELFNYQSPFAYAANNPVRFIDYMGLGYYDPELGYVSDDVDVTYYQPFDWTTQYLLENTQTQNNGSEFRGPEPVLSEPIDLGGLPEVGNGGGNGWEITGIVNNSVNTVAYGAILAGGSVAYSKYGSLWFQYYASAWTGGSRASIRTLNLTKLGARIGTGTSIIGGGLAFGQYFTSGDLPSDRARLAVGLLCAGLTYTPEPISTGVGIGLGILDASGGMNWLYNYVDYKYQRPFNISNDPLYIIDIDSNGNVTNVQYIGP